MNINCHSHRFVAFAVPCVFSLLLPILSSTSAHAQADSVPAFNAIRTPSSPGFELLGVAPTSIERPNTPAALALTLGGKTQNFSTIPKDFALEISPHWLVGHPTLTWQADVRRHVDESILRTLTISAATAEVGDSTEPVTGVSLGFRTSIFSGTMTELSQAHLRSLDSMLAGDATPYNVRLSPRVAELDSEREEELKAAGSDQDKINSIIDRFGKVEDRIKQEVYQEVRGEFSQD
jgi:hypothetical protein